MNQRFPRRVSPSANPRSLVTAMVVFVFGVGCGGAPDGGDSAPTRAEKSALSMHEIAQLAKDAGVSCEQLAVATAIAMAESNGNPSAKSYNKKTKGCPSGSLDRGLWQINDCYHPEVDDGCAYDASCNAEAMFTISSSGTKWSPWSTYKNGAYLGYLDEAKTEADSVCSGGDPAADSGTDDAADDAADDTGDDAADDAGDDDAGDDTGDPCATNSGSNTGCTNTGSNTGDAGNNTGNSGWSNGGSAGSNGGWNNGSGYPDPYADDGGW